MSKPENDEAQAQVLGPRQGMKWFTNAFWNSLLSNLRTLESTHSVAEIIQPTIKSSDATAPIGKKWPVGKVISYAIAFSFSFNLVCVFGNLKN